MSPTRLASAAALSLSLLSPAAAQPAPFVIQIWSFGFAPRPIHLAAGRPVTLTFVNRSGSGHDFTAPGFFKHARILSGGPVDKEIELRPYETRTVTLIPAPGHLSGPLQPLLPQADGNERRHLRELTPGSGAARLRHSRTGP